MTTCLGKRCSFGLPRVPFVNCCEYMYLVISLLVFRAECVIWLYQFRIIAYLFTLKIWSDFGILDLIFKVTIRYTWALSPLYFMNQSVHFDQTFMKTTLGQGTDFFRFWWPWPHFQCVTITLNVKCDQKTCVCTLSLEPNYGCWPNLTHCIIGIITINN